MRQVITILLLLISLGALACEEEQDCIDQNSWQFGLAIGLGMRTNPLIDGDNIPLIILPDIAWYGESAYFDNGELGFQWVDDNAFAFETFVTFDLERAFFSFWHPDNVLVPSFGFTSDIPESSPNFDQGQQTQRVSIDDIATRKWALNAGMRLHYRHAATEVTLSWQSDISNVHEGHKATLAYQYHWQWDQWRFLLAPRISWKSDNLINYYYGVSARDTVASNQFYTATGGFQPGLGFAASRPINDRWQWLIRADLQKLNSGMSDSPLVEQNNIRSIFVGAGYRF